jgi:hypothetical protein
LHDVAGDAVGDGFNQLALFLKERALIELGHLSAIRDFNAAGSFALYHDIGA